MDSSYCSDDIQRYDGLTCVEQADICRHVEHVHVLSCNGGGTYI